MAIISNKFLKYLLNIFHNSVSTPAFYSDPVLQLAERSIQIEKKEVIELLTQPDVFTQKEIKTSYNAYKSRGIIGIIKIYFDNKIIDQFINISVERKVIALKTGFKNLPATKTAIIMNGFEHNLTGEGIQKIFASYGLTRNLKDLTKKYDFIDINRRVDKLAQLTNKRNADEEIQKVQKLYHAMRDYLLAPPQKRKSRIENSGVGHTLFFNYWNMFRKYGILGLIDKGRQVTRQTKIGLENESKIVIDKLQHPERPDGFYMKQLESKGIKIHRSAIGKILKRWNVENFQSKFVSNLQRLECLPEPEPEKFKKKYSESKSARYVDKNFIYFLSGIRNNSIHIDAPGLLVLWYYLEKLKVLPVLDDMGLTFSKKGYCWFDHFLFNIGRIFYGISSYSQSCKIEEPSLALFSHLVKLPCNDSFINGLGTITEKQEFNFQKWLIYRLKELKLIYGKRVGFDFHHIDMDIELDRIRAFGKGYSPKRKICSTGFRPHIAWDIDSGTVVVLEFRKASARGVSTFKRFVKDFILPVFKDVVEQVYIDSEYTGKDVWNFIIDPDNGMNACLVACLKQNPFVKKYRDKFLFKNQHRNNFWLYYDENHVYSSKTFQLTWKYECLKTNKTKKFTLYCVVKKNIRNGKLRCFGTSKKNQSSLQILEDYSDRWIVENGIKDLIISYFLDKCPGTNPHHVNVHFLSVAICKQLYRIMQQDLGAFVKNSDGTFKSLHTMRELLFRQGSAKVTLNKDTIEVYFLNSFSPKVTKHLSKFYEFINHNSKEGLDIIGGLKLKFFLRIPYGEEYKNAQKKVLLNPTKISE